MGWAHGTHRRSCYLSVMLQRLRARAGLVISADDAIRYVMRNWTSGPPTKTSSFAARGPALAFSGGVPPQGFVREKTVRADAVCATRDC